MVSSVERGEGSPNPSPPNPTPTTSSQCQRAKDTSPYGTPRTPPPDGCGNRCDFCAVGGVCQRKKIPLFILVVSLVETVVYFAADDSLKRTLLYDADNRKQLWRFLTYMLLHTNELHLGLNVAIQGFLGAPLELEQGRLRCALIYFGGGLAGSLGTSAFAAFSLMAGASGGVYALLTAQIPNVVLNYPTIKYAPHRIVTVATLTAADVAYVFFRVHFYNNESPKIGWVAHAAGAAAGVLLGFLTFQGTSEWKRKFRTASCAVIALPFVFAVVLSFVPSSSNLFL